MDKKKELQDFLHTTSVEEIDGCLCCDLHHLFLHFVQIGVGLVLTLCATRAGEKKKKQHYYC